MDKRPKIIAHILNEFKGRFRAFDNTGDDKKVIAGQFPDVILMRTEPPPNSDILFLMKIESDGNFVNSFSEWQALSSTPSVLYVVVADSYDCGQGFQLIADSHSNPSRTAFR
jgi:hypothetical protein